MDQAAPTKPSPSRLKDVYIFLIMSALVGAIIFSVLSMGQIWQDGKEAIKGNYEAAEVVDLGNGRYRMYYNLSDKPESGIFSAVSTDAVHWGTEKGTRKESSDWPSVNKLGDHSWRMYYHQGNSIKSALSPDGLTWKDESGIRIDTSLDNSDVPLSDVNEPAVRKLDDKTYIMVYTGTTNAQSDPKGKTSLFFWATSDNGIDFVKKGIAMDSRNDTFNGQIDGPELVKWTDGSMHLFFWSKKGIYDSTFKDNTTFIDPRLAFTKTSKDKDSGSSVTPADPTLLRVGNKWFMYYQQYGKGIYYATLSD